MLQCLADSLNWLKSLKFNESSAPFRKNSSVLGALRTELTHLKCTEDALKSWPSDLSEVRQGNIDLQYMLMAPYLT